MRKAIMLTNKQKSDAIASQRERLNDIKNGVVRGEVVPELKKMVDWFIRVYQPMPAWEKQEVKDQWDRYFELCSQSVEAELFREIKTAAKKKDDNRVQELATQARQMLGKGITQIPLPSGYDPLLWENSQWANDYRILVHVLKEERSEFDQKVSANVY